MEINVEFLFIIVTLNLIFTLFIRNYSKKRIERATIQHQKIEDFFISNIEEIKDINELKIFINTTKTEINKLLTQGNLPSKLVIEIKNEDRVILAAEKHLNKLLLEEENQKLNSK